MSNALWCAYEFRHACRRFVAGTQIPDSAMHFILEAGRLSPSSFGLEPWNFIVTTDDELKSRVADECFDQPQVAACSCLLVITAKTAALMPDSPYVREHFERATADGLTRSEQMQTYRRTLARLDVPAWSSAQCHIAAANMMTAAAYIGVDSCPVDLFDDVGVADVLDVDLSQRKIALLLALGYRCEEPPARLRLPLGRMVEYR